MLLVLLEDQLAADDVMHPAEHAQALALAGAQVKVDKRVLAAIEQVVVVFERWIDVAFVSFLSSRVVPSD